MCFDRMVNGIIMFSLMLKWVNLVSLIVFWSDGVMMLWIVKCVFCFFCVRVGLVRLRMWEF